MNKIVEEPLLQLNNVIVSMGDLLDKIQMTSTSIEKMDWDVVGTEDEVKNSFSREDDELVSLIQQFRDTQNELAYLQAKLANYVEKIELSLLRKHEICCKTLLKKIQGGVKLVIFNEYPPKTSIFDKLTMKNGKRSNYAYAEARNRWYEIIKKAVEDYKGERIVPAIIAIKYYVPRICDTGNFLSKFILDGLMYYGPAPLDDNLENVNIVIQEAVLDKENPRTEVYIFKNAGQLNSFFEEK